MEDDDLVRDLRVERNELRERGVAAGAPLAAPQLFAIDSLHYEGDAAVEAGIASCGLTAASAVLDIGAGLGGPARFMAHTAGELELSEGSSRIKGLQTNLSVSFVSPVVEQSCVDPPICVREQLTQRVLHATTAPAPEIELVTVVWPERGEGGQPICEWTDATLTVKRPDSACDCLIFERTPEGLKFTDLN